MGGRTGGGALNSRSTEEWLKMERFWPELDSYVKTFTK
jgi:hypothetical protein